MSCGGVSGFSAVCTYLLCPTRSGAAAASLAMCNLQSPGVRCCAVDRLAAPGNTFGIEQVQQAGHTLSNDVLGERTQSESHTLRVLER